MSARTFAIHAATPKVILAAILLVGIPTTFVHAQGVRLRPLSTPLYGGAESGPLELPAGVSCSGDSFLVVDADSGSLLTFVLGESAITEVGAYRSEAIERPIRAEVGATGEVLVLLGREHRMVRLPQAGGAPVAVEFTGVEGPVSVRSFRVGPGGDLYVLDVAGSRVLIASQDGRVSRVVAFPDAFGFVSDVAVEPSGRILAVDSVRSAVYHATRADEALTVLAPDLSAELDFAVALDVSESGSIFLLDRHGGGVVVLDSHGTFRGRQSGWGWKLGRLRYPESLCVASGHMVVSDRGNKRVQVFEIRE